MPLLSWSGRTHQDTQLLLTFFHNLIYFGDLRSILSGPLTGTTIVTVIVTARAATARASAPGSAVVIGHVRSFPYFNTILFLKGYL